MRFATFAAVPLLLLTSAGMAANNGLIPRGASQPAARSIVSCLNPGKVASVQGNYTGTSSTAFSTISGTSTKFTTATKGCVIIAFSGVAFAGNSGAAGGAMVVNAVLDNVDSPDGTVQFETDSIYYGNAHEYNFVFPSVAAGDHAFKMQFATSGDDQPVNLLKYNLLVYHN